MNDPYRFRPLEDGSPSTHRILELLNAKLEPAILDRGSWDCECIMHRGCVEARLSARAASAETSALEMYEMVRTLESEGWKRGRRA